MLERIIIAGFGGQGVMLIGKIAASLAAEKHEHVTYFPSYGAEVRGGTANCHVIISDEEIASPLVEQADTLITMNQMSLDRFGSRLLPGGLALVNTSLASANGLAGAVEVPATEMADKLGNVRAANMVMLGAYLRQKPLFEMQAVKDAIAEAMGTAKQDLTELNQNAVQAGYEL
jgi:2-oxoglutarate ferredoxin oxidoreductase subunit gamma